VVAVIFFTYSKKFLYTSYSNSHSFKHIQNPIRTTVTFKVVLVLLILTKKNHILHPGIIFVCVLSKCNFSYERSHPCGQNTNPNQSQGRFSNDLGTISRLKWSSDHYTFKKSHNQIRFASFGTLLNALK
jgi:hypothetical protein